MLAYFLYGYIASILLAHVFFLPLLFKKLGLPTWKGYLPFYNWFLVCKKLSLPIYWLLVLLAPGLNIFFLMILQHELARRCGAHRTSEVLLAIFFPAWSFYQLSQKTNFALQTPTNWEDENAVRQRREADAVVLMLLSFGFGGIIFLLEKIKILKKKINKPSVVKEWTSDLAYALVAASFIRLFFFEFFMVPTGSMEKNLRIGDFLISSRFSYGVQMPRTPLSFPALHNTVPLLNIPSYIDAINWKYTRFFASMPKRNDVVVFYFPAGDTAVMDPSNFQGHNYQQLLRNLSVELAEIRGEQSEYWKNRSLYLRMARDFFVNKYGIVYRPVDKRENYVKRCVGLPGDSLSVKQGKIYINGELSSELPDLQFSYLLESTTVLDIEALKKKYDIYEKDIHFLGKNSHSAFQYQIILTEELAKSLENWKNVIQIKSLIAQDYSTDPTLFTFPNHPSLNWNIDNMGPIYLPKKNDTIPLNPQNEVLYRRAIEIYEGHTLTKKDGIYYIDGQPRENYVFAMNYFWMMGDNRHNSADSRNFGYVPEDHIGGKPLLILFSKDPEKSWLKAGLRWDRLLQWVNHEK